MLTGFWSPSLSQQPGQNITIWVIIPYTPLKLEGNHGIQITRVVRLIKVKKERIKGRSWQSRMKGLEDQINMDDINDHRHLINKHMGVIPVIYHLLANPHWNELWSELLETFSLLWMTSPEGEKIGKDNTSKLSDMKLEYFIGHNRSGMGRG